MNNDLKSLSKRYAELVKKYSEVIAQFCDLVIDGKLIRTAKKAITLEEAENIAKIRKELREVDDQIAALLRKKHE
ncbi:MAG TPA: hypothetical protein VJC01_03625 [Candidatus Paceibacterota bacterium]